MPTRELDRPAVPARVRTIAYFVLLTSAALVLLTQGLAPIWLDDTTADNVVQSAGVVSAVLGIIAGGLGVAYRPTAAQGHVSGPQSGVGGPPTLR